MDGLITANNPHRLGEWLMHCHNYNHLTNPDQPWPNGRNYPGGMLTVMDYTGNKQGRWAVSADFTVKPLSELPPVCSVANIAPGSVVVLTRDVLGLAAPSDSLFLELLGSAEFGMVSYTLRHFLLSLLCKPLLIDFRMK